MNTTTERIENPPSHAAPVETEALRPLTAKDLAMLDRIGDPQLSPDGRWLAYVVRSTDWEGNRGVNALWMIDCQAEQLPPRRLEISDKPASHPRWSPDSRWLYYLSSRSGSPQVWRTDADGAIAAQVTALPIGVNSFRLSPDGMTLVLALTVAPAGATLGASKAWDVARKSSPASAIAIDRAPMVVWDTWRSGERTLLFAASLGDDGKVEGEPRALMKDFDTEAPERPFGGDSDYAVSGREVIFSALEPGMRWGVDNHYKLYVVPFDGSTPPRRLRYDEGVYVRSSKPTLSPDGLKLALLARPAGSEEARATVMVLDLASGEAYEANPGFDRSASALVWAPDGRTLYAIMQDCGCTRLFAIDPVARRVTALTDRGEVSGASAQADRVVVVHASLNGPAQLYELAVDGQRRLTQANAGKLKGVGLSAYEQFSFEGWNGETVHGYVTRPHGHAPGRKYPVAFLIHGGPVGSFGDGWSYRWNPQVFAGMGFAVTMIDFHGSSGYGEAFAKSIVEHWGDRPLEDLQKGWAAALSKYDYLDADRACALGGSYGGYMVAWMAGVWNRPWKCFVFHDGIVDTRSWALTSDVPSFAEHSFGGPVWDKAALFERFNPLNQVEGWSKPILVVHSDKDYRVPLSQGLAAFTIAQRRNIPSKLLYFPDEGHWVQKPQNSVEWYRQVEAWMRHWTGADADLDAR
jgi:acylaminoacyl-peptidase